MNCPECHKRCKCIVTQPAKGNLRIRRYECPCKIRFTTIEEIAAMGNQGYFKGVAEAHKRMEAKEALAKMRGQLHALIDKACR